MLSSIPSQMMDTCYGENRVNISRPYPEKKFRNRPNDLRINFGQFFLVFCFHRGHAAACGIACHTAEIRTCNTYETVKTVTYIPTYCANNDVTGKDKIHDGGRETGLSLAFYTR